MYNIYLLEKFNNYYNRKVIRYNTLEEYLSLYKYTDDTNDPNYVLPEERSNTTLIRANFIPNDGITTEHIINMQGLDWTPDYLLLVDTFNEIKQRWFVIDAVRTTMGQYRLSLKRDSVADYYWETLSAPCFIEKATIPNDNPLIYNKENFSVNQIKTSETLLKDETEIPWIVGYIAGGVLPEIESQTNLNKDDTENKYTISIPDTTEKVYTNLNQHPVYKYINLGGNEKITVLDEDNPDIYIGTLINYRNSWLGSLIKNWAFGLKVSTTNKRISKSNPQRIFQPAVLSMAEGIGVIGYAYKDTNWTLDSSYDSSVDAEKSQTLIKEFTEMVNVMNEDNLGGTFVDSMKAEFGFSDSYSVFNDLKKYNGTSFVVSSGGTSTKYTLRYVEENVVKTYNPSQNGPLWGSLVDYYENALPLTYKNPENGDNPFTFMAEVFTGYLVAETTSVDTLNISIPLNPNSLTDNPYRMFCIPFGNSDKFAQTLSNNNITFYNNIRQDAGLKLAAKISEIFTAAGWLLDLQILPYCPCMEWWDTGRKRIVLPESDLAVYDLLKPNKESIPTNEVNSMIIWCSKSSFTTNIPYKVEITEPKVQNQCDMYRICSPNYAGVFEFNPVINGGVSLINVDCTYKPYNPWIHLNPDFGGLYGSDFNDNRGLICGGDFSMAQSGDKFAGYEMQNKNYQALFDRQIQNMEVGQKFQRIENIVGGVAGSVGGAASMAKLGPAGMVAGGVMGVAGGIADIAMSEAKFNEALDYTKDQFGFQLDNIKALPNTLTKTSSYNINSKYFPFIEYYTCTETEREAFRNKIKYNGMTVGVIGTIVEYMQDEPSYIKGKLIIQNIKDDFHVSNDIANEIYKGVRI